MRLTSDAIRELSPNHPWRRTLEAVKPVVKENLTVQPKKSKPQTKRLNQLEKRFIMLWAECGGPPFVLEHRFCPTRRWRFDFACIDAKVAIEIEGGIWTRGRHTRGLGYAADCMKYNTATAMGWRVFRLTSENLKDVEAVRMIVDTLRKAG